MLAPLFAAVLAATTVGPCDAPTTVAAVRADSSFVALFDAGQPYDVFLAHAKERRALWVRLTESGVIPADAVAMTAAITAPLRVLVVAIDGCSDSANSIPFVAKLAALTPSVSLRLVTPDAGKAVMEAYRTPDGRAATPTIVVLDAAGAVVGCWVERPTVLQQMAIDARAAGTLDAYAANKQSWYDADQGASASREMAAVLHGAATGTPVCSARSSN